MAQKKVLLAEDEEIIRDTLVMELEEGGFAVTTVGDGQALLASLEKEKPDIVLLDLIMPKMNGFEVLKEISASKKWKSVPVIILSNLGQDQDVEECKKLGAREHLIKSNTSIETIIESINRYV